MDELLQIEQLRIDYKATFNTEQGKRVLKDLLVNCHIFRPSFAPGKSDVTLFREGERNVALRILNMMRIREPGELQALAEMD